MRKKEKEKKKHKWKWSNCFNRAILKPKHPYIQDIKKE